MLPPTNSNNNKKEAPTADAFGNAQVLFYGSIDARVLVELLPITS